MCLQEGCACFIAPIGSLERFLLRLSPWDAPQLVPGANQAGDGQHPQLPRRPAAPMSWWIFKTARLIGTCIPNADPFRSKSLCSIPRAAVQCVLSVCGESFFPRGTCNLLLSGRELRTSSGGCIGSPPPPPDPLRGPPILPTAYGSWLGYTIPPLMYQFPLGRNLLLLSFGDWACCLSTRAG